MRELINNIVGLMNEHSIDKNIPFREVLDGVIGGLVNIYTMSQIEPIIVKPKGDK